MNDRIERFRLILLISNRFGLKTEKLPNIGEARLTSVAGC